MAVIGIDLGTSSSAAILRSPLRPTAGKKSRRRR